MKKLVISKKEDNKNFTTFFVSITLSFILEILGQVTMKIENLGVILAIFCLITFIHDFFIEVRNE